MADKAVITPDLCRQLLRFEPETGRLYWRVRTPDLFPGTAMRSPQHACNNWNARYAGQEAFTSIDGRGYRVGAIKDRLFRAHRVAFAVWHGRWPSGFIDHKNGIRTDNRPANMREVDCATNLQNLQGVTARNTGSNLLGVTLIKSSGRYLARIQTAGRVQHLGVHATPEAAHEAYITAKRRLHKGCTI